MGKDMGVMKRQRGSPQTLRMTEDGVAKMHNAKVEAKGMRVRTVEDDVEAAKGMEMEAPKPNKAPVRKLAHYLNVFELIEDR